MPGVASGAYEPDLDGYGFYKVAEMQFAASEDQIAASHPEAGEAMTRAITLAYPDAAPQGALMADMPRLTVLASDVIQAGWSWMGKGYAMAGCQGLQDLILVIDEADCAMPLNAPDVFTFA